MVLVDHPETTLQPLIAKFARMQQDLDDALEAWTLTMGKYALAERCQAEGVRALPVQKIGRAHV